MVGIHNGRHLHERVTKNIQKKKNAQIQFV